MLVDNVLIRPHGTREAFISWTSQSDDIRSFIFINGSLVVGSYMAGTKERSVILPVPVNSTFRIEVHDFDDDEVIPHSVEEPPLVRPQILWNGVEQAVSYKIYHTIFDTGTIESLLVQVPAMSVPRMEINCPVKLEGKIGCWHSFRIESVDQFGNESVNEVLPYFAADLPPPPELIITRDTQTGLLSFRINC
jgi:hypothetical protein